MMYMFLPDVPMAVRALADMAVLARTGVHAGDAVEAGRNVEPAVMRIANSDQPRNAFRIALMQSSYHVE